MSEQESKARIAELKISIKNRKEQPLPCINCISLPICVALLHEYRVKYKEEDKETVIMEASSFMFMHRMKRQCSSMYEYLFNKNYTYYDRYYELTDYLLSVNEESKDEENETV